MSQLSDIVSGIIKDNDKINASKFYSDYIELSEKYEKLLASGIGKRKHFLLPNQIEDFSAPKIAFNSHG